MTSEDHETKENETRRGNAGTGTSGTGPGPAAGFPPPLQPGQPGPEQRLHRGGGPRMLAGVAVGLADYFDVDPTIVRIGFVALTFLGGLALPVYVAGWLLIPDEGAEQSIAEELLQRERCPHDRVGAY
jgi:phage shock protein PspC (stress-responsive transcriptional regulator)